MSALNVTSIVTTGVSLGLQIWLLADEIYIEIMKHRNRQLQHQIDILIKSIQPIIEDMKTVEKVLRLHNDFNLQLALKEAHFYLAVDTQKVIRYFTQKSIISKQFLSMIQQFEVQKSKKQKQLTFQQRMIPILTITCHILKVGIFGSKLVKQINTFRKFKNPLMKQAKLLKPTKQLSFGRKLLKGFKVFSKFFLNKVLPMIEIFMDIITIIGQVQQIFQNFLIKAQLQKEHEKLLQAYREAKKNVQNVIQKGKQVLANAFNIFQGFHGMILSFEVLIQHIVGVKEMIIISWENDDIQNHSKKLFCFQKNEKEFAKISEVLDSLNLEDYWNKQYAQFLEECSTLIKGKKWDKESVKNFELKDILEGCSILAQMYTQIHKKLDLNKFYEKVRKCLKNIEFLNSKINLNLEIEIAQFVQTVRNIINEERQNKTKFKRVIGYIQDAYNYGLKQTLNSENEQLTEEDEIFIVRAIAATITTYEVQNQPIVTGWYGKQFKDFYKKVETIHKTNDKMQDIDFSPLMPQWSSSHKDISLKYLLSYFTKQKIAFEIPEESFQRTFLHVIDQIKKQSASNTLYYVQCFIVKILPKKKQDEPEWKKYYVMYDSSQQQESEPLITDSLIKKPIS